MFKNILVPLDGSVLAERALAPAMALAEAVQGRVTLLCSPQVQPMSIDDYSGGYSWWWPEQAQERACEASAEYLSALAERWAQEGVAIQTQVTEGDTASVLVDSAATLDADLIAMSTHGYSGVTRWVLGSVTEKVLRSAPCPVLVIRDARSINSVVITLDGSALAEKALEPGLEVARRLGATVTFLHVATPEPLPEEIVQRWEGMERGEGEAEQAEIYLETLCRQYEAEHSGTIALEVLEGPPAQRIVEFVAARPVDLVVMVTHGRTGLRRWAYGSVTEKVLRGCQRSMLIVRPPEHDLA